MITIRPIDMGSYSKEYKWCGPSALAMLTGMPLREATEVLTRIHGGSYDELEGAWREDVVLALHEQGYRATEIDMVSRFPDLTHGPKLPRFMASRSPFEISNPILLELTGHFAVMHWTLIGDNSTGGHMGPLERYEHRNKLVKAGFVITKAE